MRPDPIEQARQLAYDAELREWADALIGITPAQRKDFDRKHPDPPLPWPYSNPHRERKW